jgi:dTMP kinase
MKLRRGRFITLEGCEGSGKSTQARLLHEHLVDLGEEVILTREPGGTHLGDRIRSILLAPGSAGMDPTAELFLYLAARAEHVGRVIEPALAAGTTVVCDRFADATLAYQGHARGLGAELVRTLNREATGGLAPDLTLLLDLGSAEEGLIRARERHKLHGTGGAEGRFEDEEVAFHIAVREGYLDIARSEPERVVTVDGRGPVEEVHRRVVEAVRERFPEGHGAP